MWEEGYLLSLEWVVSGKEVRRAAGLIQVLNNGHLHTGRREKQCGMTEEY